MIFYCLFSIQKQYFLPTCGACSMECLNLNEDQPIPFH